MADTDVIGILSLLLAAGGALYLFRARILTPKPEASARATEASSSAPKPAPKPPVVSLPPTELNPDDASERVAITLPPKVRPPPLPSAKVEKPTSSSKIAPVEQPAPSSKNEAADESPASTPSATASVSTPPPSSRQAESLADVPRIEVDEDDDVEPTKMGRFGRREIQPPVEKLIFDEGADQDAEPGGAPLLVIYARAQTDPGKRRKQNEDSYLVLEDAGLYVVADGMGGHRGGEFASKIAVDTMNKSFETKSFEADAHEELPLEASELARAIQMSNAAILEEATQKPELKGMGTTICAARFSSDRTRLYLGHVGDSRCYRARDSALKQMTSDHTMADYGVAGPEGAHLSRALGVWPTVPIDIIMASPKLGDVYLICSDGLTKMLSDATIATQLLHEEDPKAAVERLVFFANSHGGKDNITVILLRVVEPGWKPPSERGQVDAS